MIKGMTGFGTAKIKRGKIEAVVEIRSQNHRYCDIVHYLPIGFDCVENKIKQNINKVIKRGRVTVSVKITSKPAQKISFNKEVINQYLQYAKSIKKEFGLENNLALSDIIKLPGVVSSKEVMVSPQQIWPILEKSIKASLKSLVIMRSREGKSLAINISNIIKRMLFQIKTIQLRIKKLLKDKKKKLNHDEFLTYQKSNDINEELTRLKHYVEEFKHLLKSTVSVGKKLDFVAQEMQRETNTIGSKVQDKIVSNAVIAIKSKIEKLREQALNIE